MLHALDQSTDPRPLQHALVRPPLGVRLNGIVRCTFPLRNPCACTQIKQVTVLCGISVL